MQQLYENFKRTLTNLDSKAHRYIYDKIDWSSRLVGLTGARGIGKTTLLLQRIKDDLSQYNTLYVSCEDLYFSTHKLIDLADEFVKKGGEYLFVDEVHKYQDWSKELKLIYDYYPDLYVVFTGSSILDINKGASDLSRRAVMYNMQGLSFREYLLLFHNIKVPAYSLEDIVMNRVEIKEIKHPLALFSKYLKEGYYPFAKEGNYSIRLMQVINQTLENDIPFFAEMSVATARKLKQLLAIISQSVPFKPNISSIASMLGVSRNSIADYCLYIERAGLISQLRNATGGIRGLGKVEKIYLENTNLIYALAKENQNIGNVRETFFFNQMRLQNDIISSAKADFEIGEITFEVGGKKKGQKQIEGLQNAFIVKDDIEYGFDNVLPLWTFGMNY